MIWRRVGRVGLCIGGIYHRSSLYPCTRSTQKLLISHPLHKTKQNKSKSKNAYHTNKPLPTRNPTRLRQLNIRTPIPQPIDPQLGQRDQKLIDNFPGLGVLHRQHAMSDLLHDDRPPAETRLLGTVSLEFESFARVRDVVRGDGRVVRDLFDDEVGTASSVFVGPVSVEESVLCGC